VTKHEISDGSKNFTVASFTEAMLKTVYNNKQSKLIVKVVTVASVVHGHHNNITLHKLPNEPTYTTGC